MKKLTVRKISNLLKKAFGDQVHAALIAVGDHQDAALFGARLPEPAPEGDGGVVFPYCTKLLKGRILAMMAGRVGYGLAKYGTPLRVDNGRDPVVDASQELLDAFIYVQQAKLERRDLSVIADLVSALADFVEDGRIEEWRKLFPSDEPTFHDVLAWLQKAPPGSRVASMSDVSVKWTWNGDRWVSGHGERRDHEAMIALWPLF